MDATIKRCINNTTAMKSGYKPINTVALKTASDKVSLGENSKDRGFLDKMKSLKNKAAARMKTPAAKTALKVAGLTVLGAAVGGGVGAYLAYASAKIGMTAAVGEAFLGLVMATGAGMMIKDNM